MKNLILAGWQSLETRATLWLAVILLLSLSLRAAVLENVKNIPEETTRREKITRESIEFGELTYCNGYFPFCEEGDPSASVGPVPILVFMAFVQLFDELGLRLIVILQMALNLITVVLLYQISMRMFNNQRAALSAALLWGVYFPPIYVVELRVEAEAMFTFFVAMGFLALLTGLSNNRIRYWILAGIFFGLASLSRVAFLYFPLLLMFYLLVRSPSHRHRTFVKGGALLAAFILVLSPWIIRNALVFNAFVPGGTLTGYNMYRHNHLIASDERLPPDVVLRKVFPLLSGDDLVNLINNNSAIAYLYQNIDLNVPVYFRSVSNTEMKQVSKQLLAQPGFARGDENEVETDRLFRQATLKIIKEHPDRYLMLSVYRLVPLWTNLFYEDGGLSDSTWRLIGLANIALLILSTMTLIRLRHSLMSPTVFPILLLIAYFTLGHIMVHARFRFVIPLMPYVMTFAAAQCVYWASRLIAKRSTLFQESHLPKPLVVGLVTTQPPSRRL